MSNHFKQNLKAYASLAGAVLTALVATHSHNAVLTLLAVVVTAVGTWSVENAD